MLDLNSVKEEKKKKKKKQEDLNRMRPFKELKKGINLNVPQSGTLRSRCIGKLQNVCFLRLLQVLYFSQEECC